MRNESGYLQKNQAIFGGKMSVEIVKIKNLVLSQKIIPLLVAIIFCSFSTVSLFSQGFDWQYSSRLPTDYPEQFYGVVFGGGLIAQSGSIGHYENGVDVLTGVPYCSECGKYETGSGNHFNIGMISEKWFDGIYAGNVSLRFEHFSGTFSHQYNNGPLRSGESLITEYKLTVFQNYAFLDVSGKRRFFGNFLFAGAGIELGYLLSSSNSETETIISPNNVTFQTNPQSQVRVPDGDLSTGIKKIYFGGKLSIGSDVPLARGLYASPALYLTLPITSVASDAVWRRISYGIQTAIVFGK